MNVIKYDEFLSSFAVKPNGGMSFLLGAGCSVQAGIPSGAALIWEFKRELYCRENRVNIERFKDLESESNRDILQSYFDSQKGYLPKGSPEEYSFYFEKCFPHSQNRKLFIQGKVSNINPSIGHKCLGVFIEEGKVDYIWTTNFDELIENGIKSVNIGRSIEVISPDNRHQLQWLKSQYPKIVKLHGDYRYDSLQNTTDETKELDELLRKEFQMQNSFRGLIVIGYSGSDNSVMEAIEESLINNNAFPFGLFWCIKKGQILSERVIKLVNEVYKRDSMSGFLEIDSFDEFLYNLYIVCNFKNYEIENIAKKLFDIRKPFAAKQADKSIEPIKLNAIKALSYPRSAFFFESDLNGWKELRSLVEGKNIVAALSKGKTITFGTKEDIEEVFNGRIKSDIQIADIESKPMYIEDSFYFSLLYDLIDRNLYNVYNLKRANRRKRRYYLESRSLKIYRQPNYFSIYEAFEYHLQIIKNELWFILLPTVHIIDERDFTKLNDLQKRHAKFEKQKIINDIISNRRNRDFSSKVDEWFSFLKKNGEIKFKLNTFEIDLTTSFTYGGHKSTEKVGFFEGMFINKEPEIFFSATDSNCKSIHPLKGLKTYGPLDFSYESRGIQHSSVKLGVISPARTFDRLIKHLDALKEEIKAKTEKDYLIDYPGFDVIYRKYIDMPTKKDSKYCALIDDSELTSKNQIQFYEEIKRKIDYFYSIRGDFDVLIIYLPNNLRRFRELKDSTIYFDLHDSVKLYCAKKNIKVQFIEDKSIDYQDQGKVKWWLSLGLYAKANGTLWKNKAVNNSTAFIGIGYAMKGNAYKNKFVMGCSQIYDASGRGLRFLLQPIERPIFYHRDARNPFMSKDDARKLIMKLKESYFQMDPNSKLEKLVIHKTTHFTKDEIEGIAQALDGIPNVELLQIQHFNYWRGIRGNIAKKEPHNYSVLRGTTLQLSDYSFLLWTHGSVMDDELAGERLNYYQGGRGIPYPLLVKRFRGNDPIEITAMEILNLTKMNWNSGSLYKSLPVTLDFSKALSRMAKQNENLQNTPYERT